LPMKSTMSLPVGLIIPGIDTYGLCYLVQGQCLFPE
jgi:hypothetical protein